MLQVANCNSNLDSVSVSVSVCDFDFDGGAIFNSFTFLFTQINSIGVSSAFVRCGLC